MARTNFPGLKPGGDDPARVALVGNQTQLGKLNNTLDVTLTASATSTDIADPRIYETSVFLFDPRTAHAAAELGNGTMYVSSVSRGSVTITHASNAQTDRTFGAAIFA